MQADDIFDVQVVVIVSIKMGFVTFDADGAAHSFDCERIMPQLSVRLSTIEHVA
jgi:hypothetical protein